MQSFIQLYQGDKFLYHYLYLKIRNSQVGFHNKVHFHHLRVWKLDYAYVFRLLDRTEWNNTNQIQSKPTLYLMDIPRWDQLCKDYNRPLELQWRGTQDLIELFLALTEHFNCGNQALKALSPRNQFEEYGSRQNENLQELNLCLYHRNGFSFKGQLC